MNSANRESTATNSMAEPTDARRGMPSLSMRTRQLAPMATKKNGRRYAPMPKHRCNIWDTNEVISASVGTTAATNSTIPSSVTATPVISRLVRSSKICG